MNHHAKKIICLMGPTASGKTKLAIDLVQKIPTAIISVDSAMVYRGMDVGTAKPTQDELNLAPHRLIDIRDPADPYSAGQFRHDALHEINAIMSQGNVPLLVGGTMLYFHVLQHGIAELPQANSDIRAQIQEEAEQKGWQALHQHLEKIDPLAASKIHFNDPQRIARALEVFLITGKNLTTLIQEQKNEFNYDVINIALAPAERSVLHERIICRFDQMLEQGFVDEVARLKLRSDIHADLPAMRTVGYRQIWDYLSGKLTFPMMREQGIIATRQLAKRQLTWLRGWENVVWFDAADKHVAEKIIQLCHIS